MFFLEFWKRKEVTLAYHWDVLEYEEEEVQWSNSFIKESFRCIIGYQRNIGGNPAMD